MAIANEKTQQTTTVYNPTLKAYQEISIDDFKLQLESLGMTKTEIGKKVESAKAAHRKVLSSYGLTKKEMGDIL